MNISESIKNKYQQIKNSLKESIFSKNKSILRVSEFKNKSTFSKIMTVTAVNLFVGLPYLVWFALSGHFLQWFSIFVPSFIFVLLLSNTLFFGTTKLFSTIFSLFKKKTTNEVPLIINWENKKEEVPAEYFPKGFMGRIKEFFIAAGSVATSFLPFIIFTNVVLFAYYIHNYTYFGVDSAFFGNPLNYLKIDSFLMVFLTTLAMFGIYGVRVLSFIRKSIMIGLSAKQSVENQSIVSGEAYKPQRSIPSEEFIPTLSKEFRKTHNINAYNEATISDNSKKE